MSEAPGVSGTEVVLLPLSDLKVTYLVRKSLDEDRVEQFMDLYDSGAQVPPIEVVRGTMEVHEGRHRKAAHERLGRRNIECVLIEPKDRTEMLLDAFGKNFGGSLPPSRLDVVFVMKQLLEEGNTHKRVQELFERYYKPSHARKLLKDAVSNINKVKLSKAKQAVAAGNTTAKDAARQFGVNPEILQQEIDGTKRKKKGTDISDIKVEISNRHRGNTQKTITIFRDLLDRYEDSEITEEKVLDILLHVQRLNQHAAKRVDAWVERLQARKGVHKAQS